MRAVWARRFARTVVGLLAALAAAQIAIAFLGLPRPLVHWFWCRPASGTPLPPPPDYIVVLGGGGIPSESGLIRTYHAWRLHAKYPRAQYIVSLPSDGDPETNSVGRMRDELVLRGVPAAAIHMEWRAVNTHEQAVNVAALLGDAARTAEVCVVSSAWHMRRSLGCFRKAGVVHAHVDAAASVSAEADVGDATLLRYGIWGNAQAAIDCLREAVALAAYRLRGWI